MKGIGRFRAALTCAAIAGVSAFTVVPTHSADQVRYARHSEIAAALNEVPIAAQPFALQALPSQPSDAAWDGWIRAHDSEIRARLARGDEDTLVNWLLFGTSFTSQPRALLTPTTESDPNAARQLSDLIRARIIDFLRALRMPGADERRLFARRFFGGNGFTVMTPDGVNELGNHLLDAIARVGLEQQALQQELENVQPTSDAGAASRSQLYRSRGLSLDTALDPNYGIEAALGELKTRGLITPGSIARVAVVGAGLDFTDKDAGFDVYPVQTVQPFAVVDALRRLRLVAADASPDVVILDISPRVLDHVRRARTRAGNGLGYTLNLPLPKSKEWLPEFRTYWKTLGDTLGMRVPARTTKALAAQVELTTVRVGAAVVRHLSAVDLNVVTQRMDDARFDLILATNILIYYDSVDQALASANIAAMLRSGGVLLANTALPELKAVPLQLIDSTQVRYNTANEGDRIFWYQRTAGLP